MIPPRFNPPSRKSPIIRSWDTERFPLRQDFNSDEAKQLNFQPLGRGSFKNKASLGTRRYKNLIFAGTFDNLHIGHKKMLDKAFEIADHVSIFITTKKLYHSKLLANLIPTWQVRKRLIGQYLEERNLLKRSTFFKLDTIYGSSVKNVKFDSILVTEGTRENAEKINLRRKNSGLKEFKIVIAPYVKGDDEEIVTSERIRKGEIDPEGHSYSLFVIRNSPIQQLILPDNLREGLRKPLGKVITGSVDQLLETAKKVVDYVKSVKSTMVISVGDIVTISLMGIGYEPDVRIVDLRSRREKVKYSNLNIPPSDSVRVFPPTSARRGGEYRQISAQLGDPSNSTTCSAFNKPGTINFKAANTIQKSFIHFLSTGKKQIIIVKGEEDLLALPAILFAPLGSIVLYGQWNLGVVMVEVTEEKKKVVIKILDKFS